MIWATPFGILSSVVCNVVKPKFLISKLYCTPIPPIRLENPPNRKNIHVFGSLNASNIWYLFHAFVSIPFWFSWIRRTVVTRSSAVKNLAVVGLSGKKSRKSTKTMKVSNAVVIISHCHWCGPPDDGSMCTMPNWRNPETMTARPLHWNVQPKRSPISVRV